MRMGRPATTATETSARRCSRVAGLGRGDLEAPPQFRDDRTHDGPLLLQRMHITEQHEVRPCRPPTTSTDTTSYAQTSAVRPRELDPRLLPQLERLDDVVDLDVVERTKPDTALEALANLGRVILEPLQRLDREVVGDDRAVANQPGLAVARIVPERTIEPRCCRSAGPGRPRAPRRYRAAPLRTRA